MVCLEGAKEMPAAADEVEEAKEEEIAVMNGWGPKEILTENGRVKSMSSRSVPAYLMRSTGLILSTMKMKP
jgi:hypothetical protein